MLFYIVKKLVFSCAKTEVRSSQTPYDIEYDIADLIDKSPLEMLTNKETRIILFKDPTNDIVDALCVCLSSTKKFSPGKELAEVFLNALSDYANFIDLRRQGLPNTPYANFLAMEAARTLLMQAGLFQGTLQERSQKSQQSRSS